MMSDSDREFCEMCYANHDLDIFRYIPIQDSNPLVVTSIASRWVDSQSVDFAGHLDAGIRYFELRLHRDRIYGFEVVHGLIGASANELFDHINAFLARPGFDKDIILSDFSHFNQLTGAEHEEFVREL